MDKVYIVTQDCGSGQEVMCVFSSREEAEEFRSEWDHYDIETHAVDEFTRKNRPELMPYYVSMDPEGKGVAKKVIDPIGFLSNLGEYSTGLRFRRVCSGSIPYELCGHVLARDEKHALEIADGDRIRFIAAGKWTSQNSERED